MSAAAAMKAEGPTMVAFGLLSERDKEAALAALEAEIVKSGASATLIAKLAGQLRRAADGSFYLELEIPRLTGYPTSKWIGGGHVEPWALKIISNPHEDVAQAFWLATESKIMPLVAALQLVSGPDDPIAEMSRRRVEVERRRTEGERSGKEWQAERAREAAVEAQWLQANAGRVRRWGELPDTMKALAVAADQSGDATLQRFVSSVIELVGTRSVVAVARPPAFLWPRSK